MAVAVVDLFEAVQVAECNRQRPVVAIGLLKLLLRLLLEDGVAVDPGQRVATRFPFQFARAR